MYPLSSDVAGRYRAASLRVAELTEAQLCSNPYRFDTAFISRLVMHNVYSVGNSQEMK